MKLHLIPMLVVVAKSEKCSKRNEIKSHPVIDDQFVIEFARVILSDCCSF